MKLNLRSIQTVLSLGVSLVLLLVFAGLVLYISRSTYSTILHNQMGSMTQLAASLARTTENNLDQSLSVANAIAGLKQVIPFLKDGQGEAAIEDILNAQLRSREDFETVFIFDKQGRIVAGADIKGSRSKGVNLSDRAYVQEVLQKGRPKISDTIVQSKVSGQLVSVAATPIKDERGAVLGGVAVAASWSRFIEDHVLSVTIGKGGYAYILDAQGMVVAHPNKARLLQDFTGFDFARETLSRKQGSLHYLYEGIRKVQAFEPMGLTGWIVCVNAPESELAETATAQRNALIMAGIASYAALLLVIFIWIRGLVVSPLRAIMAFSSEIARGNLKAELRGRFRFEMQDLAENIRLMTGELKSKLGFAEGVLKGIPTPCGIVGPDFRMLWSNQQLCTVLEKKGAPSEYVGMKSGEFYWNTPDRETLSDKAIKLNARQEKREVWTSSTGKRLHVDIATTPFHDMDGRMLGSISFWHDVTDMVDKQKMIEAQRDRIAESARHADAISDRLSTAAEELAAQIEESSRGTEHQKTRLGESATAIEQMNSSVLDVARSASEAAGNATDAKEKAQAGDQLVDKAMSAIRKVQASTSGMKSQVEDLSQRASGIGSIMQIIEDIADQTNLLALNAAIEAARAGDAGRGFAVVADEVRKLAEKTMGATKDVGASIGDIQESIARALRYMDETGDLVGEATSLSADSGKALQEIVSLSDRSAAQIQSIAAAAEEQSSASEQIARSAEEASVIASETAEAMNQSSQAVSELARMAGELKELIRNMQAQ